jgi:uncharacterized membrane protein SirB2
MPSRQSSVDIRSPLIEYYSEIRLAHITAAIASGSLFLLRGLLVQAGRSSWALAPIPRYLSYAIDTTLLTAALMLFTVLPSQAFSNGWLAVKLALLPLYIGLGWGALRARSPAMRRGFLAGAIAAFSAMYGIARAHDPLGPLAPLIAG